MNRHRILTLLLTLCFALTGRAEGGSRWENLEVGMNETDVAAALGSPLIVNGARGLVQWTFDAGGSVMFQQGALLFWGAPRGYRPDPEKPATLVAAIDTQAPVETQPTPTLPPADTSLHGPSSPNTPTLRRPQSNVRVASFDELRKS